jgi:hypothetical protein
MRQLHHQIFRIKLHCWVNYHIVPDRANAVYQSIGTQFKERIIDPAVQEVVKVLQKVYCRRAHYKEGSVAMQ